MSPENTTIQFSENERYEEYNCVFFGALYYAKDQFGVDLTRVDFERFLGLKKYSRTRSGIVFPKIGFALDNIVKPYGLHVAQILFQKGAREHYQSQLRIWKPRLLLQGKRFLIDERIVVTNCWQFPFLGLLTPGKEVDHLEYIPNLDHYKKAIAKVNENPGGIPIGFKLDWINHSK